MQGYMTLSDEQRDEIELLKCMYVEEYTEIAENIFTINLEIETDIKCIKIYNS